MLFDLVIRIFLGYVIIKQLAPRRLVLKLLLLVVVSTGLVVLAQNAMAHDAALGWKYPFECCSGIDCRMVSSERIEESTDGYVIDTTGEVIPYNDKRIRNSPDGMYHWCSREGKDTTPTLCLFVPPGAS